MPFMEKLPFGAGSMSSTSSSKRIVLSYIFDYVIVVVLIVGFLALDAIEPYHQEFSLRNYTLQYKFAVHERVPNLALVTIACLSPAIIVVFWTLVVDGIFSHKVNGRKQKYTLKQRSWELNCGLLGLGLSIALQYVIVASLKNAIGKPRPDLIDRCKPKEGIITDPEPFGLSNITICTQDNHAILKDGFRSFPSGHSSTAFGGLYYLSLYLAGKLHIMDSRGEVWKMFVALTPSLGAALVAGSRIMDARHHPFDVLSGSLIGIIVAWAAYRQYFPSLHNFQAKGRAYPMRTWGGNPLANRDKDEEDVYTYDAAIPHEEEPIGTSSSTMPGYSPQLPGSNAFRDEIDTAQRIRRFDTKRKAVGSSEAGGAIARGEKRKPTSPIRRVRDDNWENVSVNEARSPDEYELQPQHTMNSPPRPYEPYRLGQQTAYLGGNAPGDLLTSAQTAGGVSGFPSPSIARGQTKTAVDGIPELVEERKK